MIAVLDHGQHHVLGRQPVRQRKRMLPWHIGVLRTLQDMHRTADLDRAAEQEMLAALLDQVAGDRVGVAVFGRTQPYAGGLDLVSNFGRKPLPHQFLGKIGRRRNQHNPLQRGTGRGTLGEFSRQ